MKRRRRRDVQEGEREVADGGEDGSGGGEEEGRQLGPGAGDAQKVKTSLKLCSRYKAIPGTFCKNQLNGFRINLPPREKGAKNLAGQRKC